MTKDAHAIHFHQQMIRVLQRLGYRSQGYECSPVSFIALWIFQIWPCGYLCCWISQRHDLSYSHLFKEMQWKSWVLTCCQQLVRVLKSSLLYLVEVTVHLLQIQCKDCTPGLILNSSSWTTLHFCHKSSFTVLTQLKLEYWLQMILKNLLQPQRETWTRSKT